jgi:hypothetical protein
MKYLVWIFEELPQTKVTGEMFASYTPKAYAKTLSQPTSKRQHNHKRRKSQTYDTYAQRLLIGRLRINVSCGVSFFFYRALQSWWELFKVAHA